MDLNHDGSFTGNELGYLTTTLTGGAGTFTPTSPLPDGTYHMRARVSDQAGNEGTSAVSTMVVDTTAPIVTVAAIATASHSPALNGTVDDPTAAIRVTVAGNTYTATNNGDGTWTLPANTITPSLLPGRIRRGGDGHRPGGQRRNRHDDRRTADSIDRRRPAHLLQQLEWDADPANPNGDPAANAYDNNAIAAENSSDPHLSKTALLPGQTATFNNYTSYSLGINGIMVDFDHLPGTVTAADFEFKMGNTTTPDTWLARPGPAKRHRAAGQRHRPGDDHLGRQRHSEHLAPGDGEGHGQHGPGPERRVLLRQRHGRVGQLRHRYPGQQRR